jgi:hypothetical protein
MAKKSRKKKDTELELNDAPEVKPESDPEVAKDAEAPVEAPVEEPEDFIPDTQPVVVIDKDEAVDAEEVRKRVLELRDGIGTNYTELCRHLYNIQNKRLYESWGYQTFSEYASRELQFKKTKAMYLAQTWKNLHENQDPKVFEKVIPLGWSKAKELARVVTKENVDAWVDKAKHLGMDALVKEVREEISKRIPDDPKEASEQEDEVLGTPVENETKHLNLQFKYDDYMAVMKASEKIQAEMPGTPIAEAVGLACADFLSSDSSESGFSYALDNMKRLALSHGKEIIVVDTETTNIDFGMDTLQKLMDLINSGQPPQMSDQPTSPPDQEMEKQEEAEALEDVFGDQ